MMLDEHIEVAAGVRKRLGDCTEDDLAGAQEIMIEKTRLKGEVCTMLLDAAVRGMDVTDEVRERVDAWDECLPALRQLCDTVEEAIHDRKGGT